MFDHASPAEYTCRHAHDTCRFVDVFLEAAVEDVLEQAGKTVVVFRRDDDQGVGSLHCLGKTGIFDCLSGVINGKTQLGYIDQFRDHTLTLPDLFPNELGRMTAHAALSCSSKNYGNGKRTCFVHTTIDN